MKTRQDLSRFNPLAPCWLAAALASAAAVPAYSASYTWVGSGTSNNFSTALNWSGSAAPVSNAANSLLFLSGTRLTPVVDTALTIGNLAFIQGASSFTISGQPLTISGTGGIANNSVTTQTITSNITFGSSQTWNAAAGSLAISDTTISLSAYTLTVDGSNSTFITTVGSGITGTGYLVKNGSGTLVLAGSSANTMNAVSVNSGKLEMNNAVRSIAGPLLVGDGIGAAGSAIVQSDRSSQIYGSPSLTISSDGVLNTAGYNESVASIQMTGGSITTGTGTLYLNGAVQNITTYANYLPALISGNLDLGGLNRVLNVASGSLMVDLDLSANLTNGSITPGGTGIIRLSGSNNLSAGITLTTGTLAIGNDYALGSGVLTVPGISAIRSDNGVHTLANAIVLNDTALTIGGSNNLTFTGPVTFNTITGQDSINLVATSGTTTFSGAINEGLIPVSMQLQTSGSSTLGFSGSNAYSGGTHIISGAFAVGSDFAFGTGAVRMDSATSILATNGPRTITNALSVGTSLTIGGTTAITFIGGIDLVQGFVTVANTAVTTITAPITDWGLFKSGPGTLLLSGSFANSYIGGSGVGLTEVNQGALQLAMTGSSGGAVPNDLIIDNTGIVQLQADNQISGTSNVTVAHSGVLDLNGHFNSIATLTLSNSASVTIGAGALTTGSLNFTGGSVASGPGSLILQGNVVTNANATASTISGSLDFNSATRTFTVAAGGGAIDLDVPANILNGSLIKDGPGALRLSGSNGTIGNVTLLNGSLSVGSSTALGSGTLVLQGGSVQASGSARTISNNLLLSGTTSIGGALDITLSGSFGGVGMLTKVGTGALTIPANLLLNAQLVLASGTLNAPGLTVNSASTLAPAGSFTQNGGVYSASFTNYGTAALNGGVYTGTLTNYGTFSYGGGTFNGQLINSSAGSVAVSANMTFPSGFQNQGQVSVAWPATLTVNGSGLNNSVGTVSLSGGILSGSGAIVNSKQLNGYGSIAGSGGFTNNAYITQGAGTLTFANTGGNLNKGIITLFPGNTLVLAPGVSFANSGKLNLNGGILSGTFSNTGTIVGPGIIQNSFTNAGTIQLNSYNDDIFGAGITNTTGGKIRGQGTVYGPVTNNGSILGEITTMDTVTNAGTIQGLVTLSGSVNNMGTIEPTGGTAVISGPFQNQSNGTLRIATDNELLVTSGLAVNPGTISLTGGTYDNGGFALNNTGFISGFGTLATGGLTNNGSLTFSGGVTTVNGDVTNPAGRQIKVSNNSVNFTGNVINSGTFAITGASATFAATFTNNGALVSDSNAQIFTSLVIGPKGSLVGGAAVASLQIGGGSIASGPGVFTLNGDLTTTPSLTAATMTGALSLGGTTRTLNVAAGGGPIDLDISASVTGGAITKTGAGTLRLSGSLGLTALNANAGTTLLNSSLANAAIASGSGATLDINASVTNSTVAANGTTNFSLGQNLAALSIGSTGSVSLLANNIGSARVIETSALSIAAGGNLDLWDNAIILRDQSAGNNQATNLAMVQGWVNAAFDNGSWDKPGITSSTVVADLNAYSVLTVMVYDNTVLGIDSFEGVNNLTTDNGGNQVMLKTTYLGDFDGNGIVNSADYGWLDFYYGYGLTVGDLNGDGQVNSADYNGIDYGYGYQAYGVLAGAGTAAPASIASPESVPEPAAGVLLLSGLGLLASRRFRAR